MRRKKEFSLDLRGLRSEVSRRVTKQVNRNRQHAYQIKVSPSQVSRVLSGARGSRWADQIFEMAKLVSAEMTGNPDAPKAARP